MGSNPGGVGPWGSIERCFVLGWWDVSAVAVQPGLVEPVHPGQGGEFELVDVVLAGGVGSVDALGLVQAVGRLGERVVIGVRDRSDRGAGADLLEPLGEAHRGELGPGRCA